jgi:hypothetical protein
MSDPRSKKLTCLDKPPAFLAPAQAADEIGRLGNYRVLKILGKGGRVVEDLGAEEAMWAPECVTRGNS